MVLGEHAQRRGIYGPGLSHTCRARPAAGPLETQLDTALARLPAGVFTPNPDALAAEEPDNQDPISTVQVGRAANSAMVPPTCAG
jgi:hypothetical protein